MSIISVCRRTYLKFFFLHIYKRCCFVTTFCYALSHLKLGKFDEVIRVYFSTTRVIHKKVCKSLTKAKEGQTTYEPEVRQI
jgi:hypothetical protein